MGPLPFAITYNEPFSLNHRYKKNSGSIRVADSVREASLRGYPEYMPLATSVHPLAFKASTRGGARKMATDDFAVEDFKLALSYLQEHFGRLCQRFNF